MVFVIVATLLGCLLLQDADGIGHNIDFHAVTGPGGGAGVTYAEAGETKVRQHRMWCMQPATAGAVLHCYQPQGTSLWLIVKHNPPQVSLSATFAESSSCWGIWPDVYLLLPACRLPCSR